VYSPLVITHFDYTYTQHDTGVEDLAHLRLEVASKTLCVFFPKNCNVGWTKFKKRSRLCGFIMAFSHLWGLSFDVNLNEWMNEWVSEWVIDWLIDKSQDCNNPCCKAATCRLATNATCASGLCCDLTTCQVCYYGL